jgi:hypothetical protein
MGSPGIADGSAIRGDRVAENCGGPALSAHTSMTVFAFAGAYLR